MALGGQLAGVQFGCHVGSEGLRDVRLAYIVPGASTNVGGRLDRSYVGCLGCCGVGGIGRCADWTPCWN